MYIRIYEVYIRTYAIEGETKKEYYTAYYVYIRRKRLFVDGIGSRGTVVGEILTEGRFFGIITVYAANSNIYKEGCLL